MKPPRNRLSRLAALALAAMGAGTLCAQHASLEALEAGELFVFAPESGQRVAVLELESAEEAPHELGFLEVHAYRRVVVTGLRVRLALDAATPAEARELWPSLSRFPTGQMLEARVVELRLTQGDRTVLTLKGDHLSFPQALHWELQGNVQLIWTPPAASDGSSRDNRPLLLRGQQARLRLAGSGQALEISLDPQRGLWHQRLPIGLAPERPKGVE